MIILVDNISKEIQYIDNSKLFLSKTLKSVQLNPVEYDPREMCITYIKKKRPDLLKGIHDFFQLYTITHDNIWDWYQNLKKFEHIKDPRHIEIISMIHDNFHDIFDNLLHQFEYISASSMKDIISFLQLPFPDDYEEHFNQFIRLSRSYENSVKKVEEHVHDKTAKQYIQWIQEIPLSRIADLTKAAIYLHIETLEKLLGLIYAECIATKSVEEQHKLFSIPSHFQDSAIEKINKELDRAEWTCEMKD